MYRSKPADDALHIVDITDVKKPSLVTTYPMTGPEGLAVRSGIAYICDGPQVRVIDVRDEKAVRELSTISVGASYDVILSEQLLYIVGPNGLAIYDVTDPAKPVKVATISNLT